MKIIPNKSTEIVLKLDKEGKPVIAKYGDLLLLTINMAPEQGFSITDIRSRLKIADAINSANGEIKVEDAELAILKTSFDKFKWTQVHKDLVELSDTLNSL